MAARGVWLTGAEGDVSAAWVSEAAGPATRAVLILPPVGYEYSSSHRFCRTVAEELATRGLTALRLDYWGTGDSAGTASQLVDLQPWRRSVVSAAQWLRAHGASEIVVVGVQVGALLGLSTRDDVAPAAMVSIAPVLSGRRFTRGTSVLGLHAPGDQGISVGGTFFTRHLIAELAAAAETAPDDLPHLSIGMTSAVAAFLQHPAEEATVDPDLVEQIVSWTAALPHSDGDPPVPPRVKNDHSDSAVIVTAEGPVTERFTTTGTHGLRGVLTTPVADPEPDAVLVLLSSGSDPHTGPGRAWVELARALATAGLSTLRLDFRGWGESPDGPTVPGRPYDAHAVEDVLDIVRTLTDEGRRVVLGGLCAGAYAALSAARYVGLAGVVALNPQLYWQPGDPVEALMTTTRQRRTTEIAQIRADASTGRWDREDEDGVRPFAGQWLDDLVAQASPTVLLFAEGDDGIEYLRDRLNRRLTAAVASGVVVAQELPDIDHGMQRTWLRPMLFDEVAQHVLRMLTADADVHTRPERVS